MTSGFLATLKFTLSGLASENWVQPGAIHSPTAFRPGLR